MSRYTTELRTVCQLFGRDVVESWFKSFELSDYLTQDEIDVINERGTWSKDKLAQKIVNHYYMCEIGYETPAYFRLQVMNEMNELMEEYLPLIYSASIKYDPLVNVDYTEEFHQEDAGNTTNQGESKNTIKNDGTGLQVNSDTPQGQINKVNILSGDYATSTTGNESSTKGEENVQSSTNTDTASQSDYTKRVKGNSGVSATAQRMVAQYRDNIRAIDREIIEKINKHFMAIY